MTSSSVTGLPHAGHFADESVDFGSSNVNPHPHLTTHVGTAALMNRTYFVSPAPILRYGIFT